MSGLLTHKITADMKLIIENSSLFWRFLHVLKHLIKMCLMKHGIWSHVNVI